MCRSWSSPKGLVMYLEEDEGTALFRRIVDHGPSGRFLFDAVSRRGIRLQRFNKAVQAAGATVSWGIDGCQDLEAIHPRLRCVTCLSAFNLDGFDALPLRYRLMVTVGRLFPALQRTAAFYRLDF